MKTSLILSFLALGGVALLAACAGLSPEQQQTAISGIEQLVVTGALSRAQADAMIQALTGGGFERFLELAGTALSTLLAGFFGIYKWRGPINARNGEIQVPQVTVVAATPVSAAAPV